MDTTLKNIEWYSALAASLPDTPGHKDVPW